MTARASYTLGFHLWGSDIWTSGVYYAADLIGALRETFGERVQSKLLVYRDARVPPPLAAAADQILAYPPPPLRWSLQWWRERAPKRLFQYDLSADRFLKKNKIDVIVFGDAPSGSNIPTIGLIPDFQPFHFPEYFDPPELMARQLEVKRVGETSTRLLCYAEPVRADMEKFAPQYVSKTRIVTPISAIPKNIYALDPLQVLRAYHLPKRFFYIPNQFWQHKNHALVLKALAILRERNVRPFIVMTGLLSDHRAPSYPSELLRQISEINLRDQVALLGFVPRLNVYLLMRQALAVINPSLFEGYGMTVAETRWLGKRALLSDLPVHRVQNPPHSLYFDPRDADALAAAMEYAWREYPAGPDPVLEAQAQHDYPAHRSACADEFMKIVQEILPR